jgi:predicted phosphoadenosine phosphosulfate sulfurtransferase
MFTNIYQDEKMFEIKNSEEKLKSNFGHYTNFLLAPVVPENNRHEVANDIHAFSILYIQHTTLFFRTQAKIEAVL